MIFPFRSFPFLVVCVAFVLSALSGCAGLTPVKPVDRFEADVDALIDKLVSVRQPTDLAPAGVVCTSLKKGQPLTRLEEVVAERLEMRLRLGREIYRLTRQNWLELRADRPLTFTAEPADRRHLLSAMTVYEVGAAYDPILQQLNLRISASDAAGHPLPGQLAETRLVVEEGHPARPLLAAQAVNNPLPEGLAERPYASLDRLAFSLTAELADAYRGGVRADGQPVADPEVKVFLCGKSDTPQSRALQSALQQAIVSRAGFGCAAGSEDLEAVFRQLDRYRANRQRFVLDEERLVPGTVLLLLEETEHPDGDKVGVALRALWRIAPLESAAGDLIPTSVAGTYLSGFAAKAYLAKTGIHASQVRPLPPSTTSMEPATGPYTPANQHGFE